MPQAQVDRARIHVGVPAHELEENTRMVLHGAAETQGIINDDDGEYVDYEEIK